MAKEMVGKIGVFAPNHFDNGANLKKIRSPVMIIHGVLDDVIPVEHGEVRLLSLHYSVC
jgi:pimeloyl-ACP methyl ester carboxylesterase